VQRLGWKSELIARFEDRLIKDPLPLPPQVDPNAIKDFDYRRVLARGVLRHDQEMLIGPRMHDGVDGYQVVTPLDRSAEFEGFKGNTTVLINRGWIPKDKADHRLRPDGLPRGTVVVEGLLREPWKKNMFTPENKPAEGKFYFPDVYEMATHTNSQPVWVEETMRPDLLESYAREDKGVPIGRPPEVNLRNNHGQVSSVSMIFERHIALTPSPVHFHVVQLERRHDCHDVDAVEEAHQRHQSQSPSEQVVVNASSPLADRALPPATATHYQLCILVRYMYFILAVCEILPSMSFHRRASLHKSLRQTWTVHYTTSFRDSGRLLFFFPICVS
jgi:cytochrome oxidase assembly protein ShyY1